MHVKRIRAQSFKRFTNLTIDQLPQTARVVLMVGPNGCGKSSLFDAFRMWHGYHGGAGVGDDTYYLRCGMTPVAWADSVSIDFHSPLPKDSKKTFYIRSAYRNQADFTATSLSRMGSELDAPKASKMIDNETQLVADNYQRLVSFTVEEVFSGQQDSKTVRELRDNLIGTIRESMTRVFGDLVLTGPGNPLQDGSFFFEKGVGKGFLYKNLSGGEKAVFDIILDLILKRRAYDNTVYCIDEPELHMHTRLQARLLEEMLRLLPDNCQLWLATHSIGMMRKAKELHESDPNNVVFLDFHNVDFDQAVTITPAKVGRQFWMQALEVALDDLAQLVAPQRIVLCEGRPADGKQTTRAEFDAECYRTIFGNEYPDTDFLSVGNELDVRSDRLYVGKAIQTLVAGTTLIKLVDRDDRTEREIQELIKVGVRVLGKRHLESYLLDDETLRALCDANGRAQDKDAILIAKSEAIKNSVKRGNRADDMKSAAGEVYTGVRQILGLTQAGNTTEAFLRDTMAPLIIPGTKVYDDLKIAIFGP